MSALGKIWEWMRTHWVDVTLPPAVFLLAAGVYRQVQWARVGVRYSNWEKHYQAAAEAGKQQDRDKAFEELRAASEAAPDDAKVHSELAKAYRALGKPLLAAHHTERAFRLDPPGHDQFISLLTIYCDLGKFDDAERLLREEVKSRFPESAEAYYYEGLIHLYSGKRDDGIRQALDSFTESLRLNPKHFKAKYRYAESLSSLGRVDEAERAYRELLEVAPSNLGALSGLANVLRDQGRLDEARSVLEDLERQGDLFEQIKYLEIQRRLKKATVEELRELGELYLTLNQPGRAQGPIAEYTVLVPTDPWGHRRLAEIYRQFNRPEFSESEDKLAAALESIAVGGESK
jgi:tetratricopeptide (TPR) repeat protein